MQLKIYVQDVTLKKLLYLILNKELPNKKQLKEFKKELSKEITLSKNLLSILKKIPKILIQWMLQEQLLASWVLKDKETKDSSPKANLRKAIRILAKTPTAVSCFFTDFEKGKKL